MPRALSPDNQPLPTKEIDMDQHRFATLRNPSSLDKRSMDSRLDMARRALLDQMTDAATDLTGWTPDQLAALRTAALRLATAADAAL